jgi:hypothetical protein
MPRIEIEPLPAALAGALALGLGVQLILPQPSPLPDVASPARTASRLHLPATSASPAPLAVVDPAVLERPLFSPTRSGSEAAGAAAEGTFTLLGVASDGRGAGTATLSDAGQPARSLRLGESLDGWRLTEVGRALAVLSRDGRSQTLHVGQAPARAPAGAPAP